MLLKHLISSPVYTIIRSPKVAYLNCISKLLTNFFVSLNFITCWKARALTSLQLQLRNLAFNILGLLCKSQLRFVSCDITFTSNKRILIDWLKNKCTWKIKTQTTKRNLNMHNYKHSDAVGHTRPNKKATIERQCTWKTIHHGACGNLKQDVMKRVYDDTNY